ncbi:hypothetical protein [Mycobacterium hubeiense]|uniref:hypothetical protein n=1 Tax=Mycobacterium hubeiense TaxID=1867256 RepID=UPI000C7ED583|nr:hypothetical protein [Mycobacterium sp. QGD 101]
MGSYIAIAFILLVTLSPVLIPTVVTVAPLGVTGARRVRRVIADQSRTAAAAVRQLTGALNTTKDGRLTPVEA